MDVNQRRRKSNRLEGYDYSQAGCYFVTVCVQDSVSRFGDIVNEKMRPNEVGRVVAESWEWLESRYDNVGLDAWVIMPNHIHGIVTILDTYKGGSRTAPTKSLGRLIGAFKTVSTKRINMRQALPEQNCGNDHSTITSSATMTISIGFENTSRTIRSGGRLMRKTPPIGWGRRGDSLFGSAPTIRERPLITHPHLASPPRDC